MILSMFQYTWVWLCTIKICSMTNKLYGYTFKPTFLVFNSIHFYPINDFFTPFSYQFQKSCLDIFLQEAENQMHV
ncbi:hypothetical protein XELAEV_18013689mg [Xenopus laevis]|uniref:Uncharacterized protein n=1 Tax=Xenopus laevis TaxID=8355 RepID=A0A974DSD2_XENLA|nr:hypothetical protein XELAEV_18013689mg [Xenopus laevis]